MCFFSAVFEWVLSNAAVIVAAIAATVAALQLRASSRATQAQVFDATFNKLRELEDLYYTKNPKFGSPDETHWLSGFFNTLEYMSFLVNANLIPEKPFMRFYSGTIVGWHENIFLKKATAEEKTDPEQYPELKQLIERLKRKTGKRIWKKMPFR